MVAAPAPAPAPADVGSPIGGGPGLAPGWPRGGPARGAGGEESASSGEGASDLVSPGAPVTAMSRGGSPPGRRGPQPGQFDKSDVAAGECQFSWQGPVTMGSCESPREPLRFARIFFRAASVPRGPRTGCRCRWSQQCIPCCPSRAAIAPLCRSGGSGVNPECLFRFLGPRFIRCAFLAASSYTRTGGLAT
jgi:hypothetical protein